MSQVDNEFLVLLLNQLVSNEAFAEKGFIRKLQLVAENIQNSEAQKNVDIAISSLKQYIQKNMEEFKESEELKILSPMKQLKVKRLYVDGCFDLMHSGHFNAIRQAKQYCETLVVGVIAQDEITKRKGPPVLSYEERVGIAKACKWADEICEHAPYDPTIELIDRLNCSHVAHGDDMIVGPDGCDAYSPFKISNRMITFKRTEGISTTDIVGRLLLMTKNQQSIEIKKIRKLSGEQGITASKIESLEDSTTISTNTKEVDESTAVKLKLLNTTKRIRQFSQGNREPKEGDKIVYIDGSFDMLHIGHIETLKKAKELGDYLIVGLHDDETVQEKKGSNYPVLTLQERVLNVLAMKYVDEVIIGAPWQPTEQLIKQFNINIVVEGTMTKLKENKPEVIEQDPYSVPKKLGIFQQIESSNDMTTDKIVERIIENRMRFLEIYNVKNKKQDMYYEQERKVKEV
ncbi:hypothetical protein ABPG74_010151 [Tetrahymena malaccensis]